MIMRVTGPYPLMLIAAGLLMVCIADQPRDSSSRCVRPGAFCRRTRDDAPSGQHRRLELLLRDRYLLLIALLVLLLNIVNNSGEFLLGRFVTGRSDSRGRLRYRPPGKDHRGVLRTLRGLVQQRWRWGCRCSPCPASSGTREFAARCSSFPPWPWEVIRCCCVLPVLPVIRWLKILENGADYSIQNTTVQALFLPTSREAKYKAKAAIDTFFKRAGDVLEAGVVKVGSVRAWGSRVLRSSIWC